MEHNGRIRKAMEIAANRYDFRGKSGVALCCANGDSRKMPNLISFHAEGQDLAAFEIPECDFCIWLTGFAEAVLNNRQVAEDKLAEASFRCSTMFFSSDMWRPAKETILRHTRYEHAIDIGEVGGRRMFMCW